MTVVGEGREGKETAIHYEFDHVLLWVKDEEVSKELYANTLGLELLNDDNETGLYTVGTPVGFVLALHRKGVDEEGTGLSVGETGTRTVHFDFRVSDVDKAYETLRRRGVKFISPPRDMPWGERHT